MKSELEIQKELFLLKKGLLVIQKCEEMLADVEEALATTYDDAGLKAFRCRVECQINELTGDPCPYCEDDDFYVGEWKVPEGIPYNRPESRIIEANHDPM